jgi:signal transduction histidine kinase
MTKQTQKPRVLIIDDSKLVRSLTGRALRENGMTVETAEDGREGCKKVFEFEPDVILVDLSMPVMSGSSAIRFLKSNHQTKHIPIVVFTSETIQDEKLKALEAGANDLLNKEADESELVVRVRNLVQLKALEDEVLLQRDRLSSILNDLAQAVIILDNTEKIFLANAAARLILNIPTELIGQLKLRDLLESNAPEGEDITDAYEKLVGTGIRELVVDLDTSTGPRTFKVTANSVFLTGEEPMGRALVFWDVTQERELERMKASFYSMIAHDLRSPITVITGYTDLLLNNKAGELSELQIEFLRAVEDRSTALRKLVDEFLTVSKFQGTKITLDRKQVDLNALLGNVAKSLVLIANNKEITVTAELDETLPEISADSDKLQKVFSNLYDNALKYTPDGGAVTIRSRFDGDRVRVEIADTGIGIDAEELPYVFEPYKRMSTAHKRKIKGTGLGLSIVKQIVEAHEGRVWTESEPEKGSRFFVELPLEITAKESPEPAEVC